MPGRTATHHGADSAEDLTRRQSGFACQAHWLPDRLRARRAVGESGRPEQLLHGEPHPGNLLSTRTGPLFIDFETCCRGPIEFDLAHAPDDVGDHYPGVDRGLLRDCRTLMLAMITTWRWDREDQFPNGHRLGVEWLSELRKATAQSG